MLKAPNFISQSFLLAGCSCYELVYPTCTRVLAWAKTPCLSQRSFFSDRICAANNETYTETETAQALFNGQRMEKWEPSSQINFSTQFGQRHQMCRRVEVKGRKLERVGGIFMNYLKTEVWFGLGTDAALLLCPCMGFSTCCHGRRQLSWSWWLCDLAC